METVIELFVGRDQLGILFQADGEEETVINGLPVFYGQLQCAWQQNGTPADSEMSRSL